MQIKINKLPPQKSMPVPISQPNKLPPPAPTSGTAGTPKGK